MKSLWMGAILITAPAWAYIPEYALIASRTADQHGSGAYKIEQEVTFKRDADSYTVKETWLVTGENNLRLTVEGRGPLRGLVTGTIIYDGSVKFFTDTDSVRNQGLSDEWIEPLFHFRNSRYLRSRLVNLKVAPQESLRDRPPMSSEVNPEYQAPGFIRLSRTGGSIAWEIGNPPGTGNGPRLWIEQDQFVIRKFRGASNFMVRADEYAKFDEGFWFPRTRTYIFEPFTVQIKTLQVQHLGKLTNDPRFKSASLNPKQDTLRLPDAYGLKEFYQRFR